MCWTVGNNPDTPACDITIAAQLERVRRSAAAARSGSWHVATAMSHRHVGRAFRAVSACEVSIMEHGGGASKLKQILSACTIKRLSRLSHLSMQGKTLHGRVCGRLKDVDKGVV